MYFFIGEEADGSDHKDRKQKDGNWMEEAEKRLQLLKLEVEKEDGDDWSDSDGDFSDEEDESDDEDDYS